MFAAESMASPAAPTFTLNDPVVPSESAPPTQTSSSPTTTAHESQIPTNPTFHRPRPASRHPSATMLLPHDSAAVESHPDDDYDENYARTMSPRRSMDEIERMNQVSRAAMKHQATVLQASLLALLDRVETVKTEHERLEGGNRFLQSYIGELMQTSKITSTGAAKSKGKRKGGK